MKQIDFYLDFISPYAYLAFEKLPDALMDISYGVTYKPVLFAAMLQHHGQLGPAEIKPKRDWTYRQVSWQAHANDIPFSLPAKHPFNPLPLLRLAVACSDSGTPNRYVTEIVLHHAWRGGADAADPQRIQALTEQLGPGRDVNAESVKAQLRANTEEAIARGVFGVPTMAVDDKLFWGFDALPMLRAYLLGDAWFEGSAWSDAAQRPVGISRVKS